MLSAEWILLFFFRELALLRSMYTSTITHSGVVKISIYIINKAATRRTACAKSI